MGRRGVIFDLDGTLLDTLDDIGVAVNALMARLGHPAVTRQRLRSIIGDGMANLLRRASGIDDPDRVRQLVAELRPIYGARMLEHTRPYDGVEAMLDRLTDASVPTSILSNKAHEYTVPICQQLLGRWHFRRCQGQTDDRPRKPDPTVALELAEALGCDPPSVLFIGDSVIDVRTARHAGMIAVAVTWGYGAEAELRNAAPDHIIHRPADLCGLLNEP